MTDKCYQIFLKRNNMSTRRYTQYMVRLSSQTLCARDENRVTLAGNVLFYDYIILY